MELKPTEKELEILQVIWKEGPSTVREVNDALSVTSEVGYTTTLKLMQIMFDKGLLSRTLQGKTHRYTAQFSQEKAQATMLEKLMSNVFEGSAKKLVMQALGNSTSTDKELEEIRAYIEQLKKERNA